MKLSEKLWCDLKSDSEKHSWLLMGMGVSTGVVCHAIQTDLANSYHVKMLAEKERDQLRELCGDLLDHLKHAYYAPTVQINEPLEKAITKAEKALGESK